MLKKEIKYSDFEKKTYVIFICASTEYTLRMALTDEISE